MKKTKSLFLIIGLLLMAFIGLATAQTNSPIVQPTIILNPTTSLSNVVASVPAGVTKVATDGYNFFKTLSLTNPISVGAIGVKNGSLYGGGLEVNGVNTNSSVNAGFAVLAIQTEQKQANGTEKKSFGFYDASLNLSISQVENIPVINLPLTMRIFSGPFASLNGGVLIGEQSGVAGDLNFEPFKNVYFDFGGGIINDSGAAAAGLKPVMPMAHFNVTFTF